MALRDRSQRLGLLNGNIAKIIGKLKGEAVQQIDPETANLPQVLDFLADHLDAINRQSYVVATAILDDEKLITRLRDRLLNPEEKDIRSLGIDIGHDCRSYDPDLCRIGSALIEPERRYFAPDFTPFNRTRQYGEIKHTLVKDIDDGYDSFNGLREMSQFLTNWNDSIYKNSWKAQQNSKDCYYFEFLLHLKKLDVFMEYKLPSDLSGQVKEAALFFQSLENWSSDHATKKDIFYDAATDMYEQKKRLDRIKPQLSRLERYTDEIDSYQVGKGSSIINPFSCDHGFPYDERLREPSYKTRQAIREAIEADARVPIARALHLDQIAEQQTRRKKRIFAKNVQEIHILQHLYTQSEDLHFYDYAARWKKIKKEIQGTFGKNTDMPDWNEGMERCVNSLVKLNQNWSYLEAFRKKVRNALPSDQHMNFDFHFANTFSDKGLKGTLNALSIISEQHGIEIEKVGQISSIIPEREPYDGVPESVSAYKRLASEIEWEKSLAENIQALSQVLKGYPVLNQHTSSPHKALNECGAVLESLGKDILAAAKRHEQKRIPVTQPLKQALRESFETAGMSVEALLEGAADKPETLSPATIHAWQKGRNQSASVGELAWVINAL